MYSSNQAFKAKELTLLLWSLSRCGHHEDPLFAASATSLLERISRQSMGWQDMAHAVWAYASAGKYDPRIFSAVSDACYANLPGFVACPAALDTVMGSLCMAGHYHAALFDAVAQQLRRAKITAGGAEGESQRLHDQNDFASLARDIARASSWDQTEADEAWELGHDNMRGNENSRRGPISPVRDPLDLSRGGGGGVSRLVLKPSQAANLLASLATLHHKDDLACASVVSGLKAVLACRPHEVQTAAVTNCLWAMAVLEYWDAPFMQLAFGHVAEQRRRHRLVEEAAAGCSSQRLSLSEELWSRHRPPSTGASLPEGGRGPGTRIREDMRLLQATLWLTAESSSSHPTGTAPSADAAREVLDALPEELLDKATSIWKVSAASAVAVSLMQKEVQAALVQHVHVNPQVSSRPRCITHILHTHNMLCA